MASAVQPPRTRPGELPWGLVTPLSSPRLPKDPPQPLAGENEATPPAPLPSTSPHASYLLGQDPQRRPTQRHPGGSSPGLEPTTFSMYLVKTFLSYSVFSVPGTVLSKPLRGIYPRYDVGATMSPFYRQGSRSSDRTVTDLAYSPSGFPCSLLGRGVCPHSLPSPGSPGPHACAHRVTCPPDADAVDGGVMDGSGVVPGTLDIVRTRPLQPATPGLALGSATRL